MVAGLETVGDHKDSQNDRRDSGERIDELNHWCRQYILVSGRRLQVLEDGPAVVDIGVDRDCP